MQATYGHYGHTPPKVVEGTVTARQTAALQVDGTWIYTSKFFPVTMPATGARVQVEIDELGYITELKRLNSPMPAQPIVKTKPNYLVLALMLLAGAILISGILVSSAMTTTSNAQIQASQQASRQTTAAIQQASNQATLDQQAAANAAQMRDLLQQQYADSAAYQAHQDAIAQQLAPRPLP